MSEQKITVGLVEQIKVMSQKGEIEVLGKFDTSARRTSIDKSLIQKIKAKPTGKTTIHNVHGSSQRPLVKVNLKIKGKRIETEANVADRSSMKYKVIIGRDIIFSNFVVDITKSHSSPNLGDLK